MHRSTLLVCVRKTIQPVLTKGRMLKPRIDDKAANNTGSKSLDTVNTTGTVKPDTLKTADLGSGANPQQKMSQMALVGVMLLYIAFQ